jgi:hypothetical protein
VSSSSGSRSRPGSPQCSAPIFIGYECAFTGHAPIDIADEVMIAHKVNLVTGGHPVEPDQRREFITAGPIRIDTLDDRLTART